MRFRARRVSNWLQICLGIGILIGAIALLINFKGFKDDGEAIRTATPVLAVMIAMFGLYANEAWKRRSTESDRQRAYLDRWFETLAAWAAAEPLNKREMAHLMDPYLVQLHFRKADKHVAHWHSECMYYIRGLYSVVEEIDARRVALQKPGVDGAGPHSIDSLNAERLPLTQEMMQTIHDLQEHLLQWHHGDLRGVDFYVPFVLRRAAREEGKSYDDLLASCGMQSFASPKRLSIARRWQLAAAVRESPRAGMLIDLMVLEAESLTSIALFAVQLLRRSFWRAAAAIVRRQQSDPRTRVEDLGVTAPADN